MDQIALETKRPRAALQQFVDSFEKAGITTIEHLKPLSVVELEKHSKLGIANRLKQFVEVSKSTTVFCYKECLILHQSDYSELRKNPAGKDLGNLKTAADDAVKAEEMALKLGIP